jgi:mycothiol synthase
MADVLPVPLVVRRPTTGDAEAIHQLVSACDVAAIGRSDTTVDDVADELVEPGFALEHDSWLVHEGDRLVGWGWACRKGESDNVGIDVYVAAGVPAAGEWLWTAVVRRGLEIARELGHARAVVDMGVHRDDYTKAAAARERGFEVATSFYRMRVDHAGPVPDPALPEGVALLTAGDDETLRRVAHAVRDAAFTEHFGFYAQPYDDWAAALESSSSRDWSQLRVATVNGVPAAMLLGNNQFVPDEGGGYVAILAVLPAYRGRGLGALLLRDRFAADARLGRVGTILHVDANNTTPALGLYESVGMRTVLVIDVWRQTLPT